MMPSNKRMKTMRMKYMQKMAGFLEGHALTLED